MIEVVKECPELAIRVDRCGTDGTVTVAVAGEIDVYTAPRLHEAVTRVLRDRPPAVHLDLGDVTFFSCAGATVIARWRGRRRGPVLLTRTSGPVDRLLRLVHL